MPRRRTRAPASQRSNLPAALAVAGVPARLAALQVEHQRLLKEIARKTKELGKWTREIDEATHTLAEMYPLRDEALRIDRALHALFAELLARKRYPRGERQLVTALYDVLQEIGVLSPLGDGEHVDDDDQTASVDPPVGDAGPEPSPFGSPGQHARTPPSAWLGETRDVASAVPGDRSIREVFRRLAMAVHPDRVRDESQKILRTELMKDISRAYQEHDLARLLQFERAFQEQGGVAPATGDARCLDLSQLNAALREQLKALARELLGLRRSPEAELVKDLRRWARAGGPHPVATAIADAQAELASMRETCAFVAAYRDGKITIGELMRGPVSGGRRTSRQHAGDAPRAKDAKDDHDGALDDLLNELLHGSSGRTRRGKARRPKSHSQDIPF